MLQFESFTYPFFDLNHACDHRAVAGAYLGIEHPPLDCDPTRGLKALYIHIPFCDTLCHFCPFNKWLGTPERITAYLAALHQEMRTLGATARMRSWEFDSVYIGGGTPSVLTVEQIAALFTVLRDNFAIAPGCEISFEFEAKSISEEKLTALSELGVTRVSFGVQSFHEPTRKMVNITATLDQVRDSIAWSTALFGNTNLDMMVGFPGQDLDAALVDAHTAATSGIGSVSIYPVDYVMTLPGWQDRIRDGRLPRPADLDTRSKMFHDARAAIIGAGMGEQNMYCFGDPTAPPTRYMFSTLYGGYRDEAVGVGAGAYTLLRGLTYSNVGGEDEYIRLAGSGVLPVARVSPYHAYEKGLVFFPKRLTFQMADLDALGLAEVCTPKIDELVAEGYATVGDGVLRLTEPGKLVYSELMAHFFSDSQRRLYLRMVARMSEQIGMIDADDWAGTGRRNTMGARNALPVLPSPRLLASVK